MRPVNSDILICSTMVDAAKKAAGIMKCAAKTAVEERGEFNVAVPGGWSPRPLYEYLAIEQNKEMLPYDKTRVYFTDERCVPPDSEESNYKLACDMWLSHVDIASENIVRMEGEADPEVAARKYSDILAHNLGDMPVLDLVILAMGPDGHTASLFPDSSALGAHVAPVVTNYLLEREQYRLTMTVDTLSSARNIVILCFGDVKAEILKDVLQGPQDIKRLPVQSIRPRNGSLLWIVDAEAAGEL